MISVKHKYLILISCILISVWLLVAQVLGSRMLLIPCLLCFLALSVWSAIEGMAAPVFMLFLPFSPLLRLDKGSMSFFTIALLSVYLIYAIIGCRNVRVIHIVPALCLIGLIMAVKTAYGYSFDNNFIMFGVSLLLIPFISREINGKYDFYLLTVFFVIGISIASISAMYLVYFPNISRFISTYSLFGATRHSGFYGDPNFYSAQITAALSGVLILLLKTSSKKKIFSLIIMIAVLIFCGLLSVSKSFFLIAIALLILWFLALLFNKGKISAKITLILVLLVGAMFLLSSTVFTDMIDDIIVRFSRDSTLSDLTTGRSEIWTNYMRAFAEDPLLLLFGNGYKNALIAGKGSHNTIIQSIFQFGLVGSALLTLWVLCFVYNLLFTTSYKFKNYISIFILIIGSFGPWLAIDLLFFDEFFLVPLYCCIGIRFLIKETPAYVINTEMSMNNG